MVISFLLHGAVLLLLIAAGGPGSTALSEEPAFLVEFSLAAPAPSPDASPTSDSVEASAQPEAPPPPPPEPVTAEDVLPESAPAPLPPPEPEIALDLPAPDTPPPLNTAELKPPDPPRQEPPKPRPPDVKVAAKVDTPRPPPKAAVVTQTASPPDRGVAEVTQTAAATPAASIVWEDRPRFRSPPTPALYPPRALELGHHGEARVRVRLDPDGTAAEILLWRGTGFDLLDRAALAAVRGWRFLPAMRDGRAVAAWVEIPVRFSLR